MILFQRKPPLRTQAQVIADVIQQQHSCHPYLSLLFCKNYRPGIVEIAICKVPLQRSCVKDMLDSVLQKMQMLGMWDGLRFQTELIELTKKRCKLFAKAAVKLCTVAYQTNVEEKSFLSCLLGTFRIKETTKSFRPRPGWTSIFNVTANCCTSLINIRCCDLWGRSFMNYSLLQSLSRGSIEKA